MAKSLTTDSLFWAWIVCVVGLVVWAGYLAWTSTRGRK